MKDNLQKQHGTAMFFGNTLIMVKILAHVVDSMNEVMMSYRAQKNLKSVKKSKCVDSE